MLKCYMSGYHETNLATTSEEEKHIYVTAFQEALCSMGRLYRLEADDDNNYSIPKVLSVQLIKQGWDIQVRIHMGEENAEAVRIGFDRDASDTNSSAETENSF